jgi:NAD(P)-dependent dehydrogenase (short-subunit alcohol dehydrogenase family)
MANELRADGFCCVCVHPGWVKTDMGGPNAPLLPPEKPRYLMGVGYERDIVMAVAAGCAVAPGPALLRREGARADACLRPLDLAA